MDLGLGTNTAASVEKFFDTINPFDEAADSMKLDIADVIAQ